MKQQTIFQNTVQLTNIRITRDKQYAYGIILEEAPRSCFLPAWAIKAFGITEDDAGTDFECLFIETERDPLVIRILSRADYELKPSVKVNQTSEFECSIGSKKK